MVAENSGSEPFTQTEPPLSYGLKEDAEAVLDLTIDEKRSNGTLPLHLGYTALELEAFLLGQASS